MGRGHAFSRIFLRGRRCRLGLSTVPMSRPATALARCLVLFLSHSLAWAGAGDRPHLVLIFADDFGYGDPGCYGGTLVPTPAIDSLARDGIRFTDAYVTAPVCAPSRCGLLSGAYNQRFGMQWNDDRAKYQFREHRLLPQALRSAGYLTGHLGKWNVPVDPRECFDEVQDLIDWEADYFPDAQGHYVGVESDTEHASSKVQGIWGPGRPGEEYLTDRIGRHAVEFVEKHKSGDKPFFLYLAFNAVHSPFHAKQEMRARFAGLTPPLDFYAAMVASMDENIGRVLAALPENTLVAFTADNGPAKMPVKEWPSGWPVDVLAGSAGPLSGHKAQMREGGIREPFLLRWTGRLQEGGLCRHMVSTMDLYPTFLAAAGAPVPAGTQLDGVNLLPFLQGGQGEPGSASRPHDILFWKRDGFGAVREGDWKLVLDPAAPRAQLFDLAGDIGETRDRAADQPALAQRLRERWQAWSDSLPPRANPSPAKPAPGKSQEREALFQAKDKDRDGKLSWEEFLGSQPKPQEVRQRFETWDTGAKGFLTRDDFVRMGAGRK